MKDLSRYGTEDWPLHPSGLAGLVACNWRSVVRYLFGEDGESGPAADTGTATHVAVREFHRGKGAADSLKVMRGENSDFPLADLQEAAAMFLQYIKDPRNRDAEVVAVEKPIRFTIDPAPEDPTGEAIVVEGTLDQVRRESVGLKLWDLKTSKKDGVDLLQQHQMQVAAYCVGATLHFKETVQPGGLILPRKYRADGSGAVFWPFVWTLRDVEYILAPVRHVVAMVRSGNVWHAPNSNCRWCSMRTPDLCLPKLQELRVKL